MQVGGLIVLGLFLRQWSVDQCKQNFDTLTRQIFEAQDKGSFEPFRHLRRILKCWLSDGYYDAKPFEDTLKLVFGPSSKMFDFHDSNNTKVAVTATTISDALPYVISNYNGKVERPGDSGK